MRANIVPHAGAGAFVAEHARRRQNPRNVRELRGKTALITADGRRLEVVALGKGGHCCSPAADAAFYRDGVADK
jgi:hypothetical protein